MEFVLSDFVNSLRDGMANSKIFPYEKEWILQQKHANRPFHIKDIAFLTNPITQLDSNTYMFEIGNTYSEENYPYYHILEDAPVIRKRGRGSDKTRGSQARVSNLGQRDYSRISFNGKTYSKEYAKNVRGMRKSVIDRAQRYVRNPWSGLPVKYNPQSDSYKNIHYQYIERIFNSGLLDLLASEYGLKKARVENTGLTEEYLSQFENEDLVSAFINSVLSFEGEEDYD